MKRVILYSVIALSSICASAQEYKNTLNPAFCSLGDTIYAPLDTVLFAFDEEIRLLAEDTEEIKAHIFKDGKAIEYGNIIDRRNKHGKGYVSVKYSHKSSLTLQKGNYQAHIIRGAIGSRKDEYVSNDDLYIDFTVPDNLGYGITSFSGDTISKANYNKFKFKFPTDIKAAGIDNYLILNQEWKEPVKIPFTVYEHYLYAELEEPMYFDNGMKYTLTLPAGSVSAKYRDDIVNLETSVNFVGGHKSGVENVKAESISMTCVNDLLTFTGISAGTEIAVFSVDGKAVANMIAGNTTAEIALPAKGIYLVTVNGKSHKIAN